MATGHTHTVVNCQLPSSFDFAQGDVAPSGVEEPNLMDRNFNLLESEMLHFVQHDNKVILSGAKNLI